MRKAIDHQPLIQVDAFEVQLGAALLIQIRVDGEVIRILADAGIMAKGYGLDHVRKRLGPAMAAFDARSRRIDLVVGTHYDRDHLDGLVPVMDDQTFDFGEAWMPPVLNDQDPMTGTTSFHEEGTLGRQLEREEDDVLIPYLTAKADDCSAFAEAAEAAEAANTAEEPGHGITRSAWREIGREPDLTLELFESHLEDAGIHPDGPPDIPIEPPGDAALRVLGYSRISAGRRRWLRQWNKVEALATRSIDLGLPWNAASAASLRILQAGSAKDAISAISLDKVVQALRRRKVPTRYRAIDDGMPDRFAWNGARRRFETFGGKLGSTVELTMLGPSQGLVQKHALRLPRGHYLEAARLLEIPVQSITPSNQLSYVFTLEAHGQRILTAGDCGMVDFKRSRSRWHEALISALRDLHVVQVAHHAGNNAYFYHALDAAPGQSDEMLVLSHATHDKYRPSAEFGAFLRGRVVERRRPSLLFTSTPSPGKVADYRSLIQPTVGPAATVGDIRLTYDLAGWKVESHAVSV